MANQDSRFARANPELVVAFRDSVHRYVTAEKASEREASVGKLTAMWARLRDDAEAADLLTPSFPAVASVEDSLVSALREDDPDKRSAASDALVSMFVQAQRGIAAAGTPTEPGARWRPDKPPLAPADKANRLKQVSADTRHTARSLADAVRKVAAARRERGVPLHGTYSTETRAAYAAAVTDYALGLVAVQPIQPGITRRTAPWGTFKVRSSLPPNEALDHFAASPPLPVRGELLESRSTRIRLAPLNEPAQRAGGDAAEDDDG
jgi:hypothetical protein